MDRRLSERAGVETCNTFSRNAIPKSSTGKKKTYYYMRQYQFDIQLTK